MNNVWTKYIFHAFGWIVLYLLPYVLAYGEINIATIFRNAGDVVHGISSILLITYSYVNFLSLVPGLYLKKKYLTYFLFVVICLLVVIWLPNLFNSHEFSGPHGPSHGSPPGGRPPHEGPPRGGLPGGLPNSILFGANYNIILFILSTFLSISLQERLLLLKTEKEKLRVELSFLKAQINPHFLFNTLNSIYSLAIRKDDKTADAIVKLSELMRYILKGAAQSQVPLQKELDYIHNYIDLQKTRLGDSVPVFFSQEGDGRGESIAPLLLIPFIENAFKYGVNPDDDSEIRITVVVKESILYLDVFNKKVAVSPGAESSEIGIRNTRERLCLLYSGRHSLTIMDTAESYSVLLTIDLK